jgi:hypothetical protein
MIIIFLCLIIICDSRLHGNSNSNNINSKYNNINPKCNNINSTWINIYDNILINDTLEYNYIGYLSCLKYYNILNSSIEFIETWNLKCNKSIIYNNIILYNNITENCNRTKLINIIINNNDDMSYIYIIIILFIYCIYSICCKKQILYTRIKN